MKRAFIGYITTHKATLAITASTLAALLFLVVILVVISSHSLPGNPTYPFKRMAEDIRLATAFTPLSKASDHISQANARLDELDALYKTNHHDPHLTQLVADIGYQDEMTMDILDQAKNANVDIQPVVHELCESLERQQPIILTDFDPGNPPPDTSLFTAAAAASTLSIVRFGISTAMGW